MVPPLERLGKVAEALPENAQAQLNYGKELHNPSGGTCFCMSGMKASRNSGRSKSRSYSLPRTPKLRWRHPDDAPKDLGEMARLFVADFEADLDQAQRGFP